MSEAADDGACGALRGNWYLLNPFSRVTQFRVTFHCILGFLRNATDSVGFDGLLMFAA